MTNDMRRLCRDACGFPGTKAGLVTLPVADRQQQQITESRGTMR
jgi:hypothetical protein